MIKIPQVKLNNGQVMPSIGFGTWQIVLNGNAKRAVAEALSVGYRLIDTARIYGNEKGVGTAIRESLVPRNEIFVTTKLWNSSHGYDKALKAFDQSLKRLGLDYIDLYLIHWPVSGKRVETWRALEEIHKSGRAKAIGVSNFLPRHLEEIKDETNVIPAVNQVEFHPYLYSDQLELLAYCKQKGIIVEAYSPLAHGQQFDESVLPAIAAKYHKTQAQVILRWALQKGTVPIPKTTNPDHMKQNLDIFDFELSRDDIKKIDGLSNGTRTCWNPNRMQ